jgi:hypothetical protein
MRGLEFPLVSNGACPYAKGSKQGLYFARAHFTGPNGIHLPPEDVDLGWKLPEDLSPLQAVGWVHGRLASQRRRNRNIPVDEKQIVALNISRLCMRASHDASPATPYLSARRERVKSLLLSRHGAQPVEIVPPNPRRSSERDLATVRLRDPEPMGRFTKTELPQTVILESAGLSKSEIPYTRAIELHTPGRAALYGAFNDLVEVVDYDAMWAGDPHPQVELPPLPVRQAQSPPEQPRLTTPRGYGRQTPPPAPDDPPPF